MIFDTDDLHDTNSRLDLLGRFKDANPSFRMTAFAVPALCSKGFLDDLPEWIEVVPHGWLHPHPREAENWTYDQAIDVLLSCDHPRWVEGWKSPGWQVSDGTYQALLDLGYWIADHSDNDARRPEGLLTHVLGDGDHVHTHVQDWGSNGLNESWDYLLERVTAAESFEFISEVVVPWRSAVAA